LVDREQIAGSLRLSFSLRSGARAEQSEAICFDCAETAAALSLSAVAEALHEAIQRVLDDAQPL
jgi:hypothetical protein